jgi:type III secretion system needle length determinant
MIDRKKTNPFESIFKNSFFSESKVQETQILTKTDMDFELTDKLVDRILVSDAKAGESEVRLQLSDNILKDTEISIKRLLDGSLEIKLNSGNYNSAQTLVSQQFELKSRLEKMENCTVTVEVNTENQEQGNDANQKSRGLFDFYNQEQS